MKKNKLLLMLFVATLIGTTFSSCEKEECDVCAEMPTTIKSYEKTILIRFNVPKDKNNVSVTINGTLLGYDEYDADGMPLNVNWESKSFSVGDTGVKGHYSNIMSAGEPVPGAEIIIEQEPYDDPVTSATGTTNADGHFTITLDGLSSGNYHIRVTSNSNSSKAGFAVGGFNAT